MPKFSGASPLLPYLLCESPGRRSKGGEISTILNKKFLNEGRENIDGGTGILGYDSAVLPLGPLFSVPLLSGTHLGTWYSFFGVQTLLSANQPRWRLCGSQRHQKW